MRPIDLQDNLSKAPLVSREQQIQQSSADQAQRLGAMRLHDERALDQTRIQPGEETEVARNRVDRESDSEQGRRQQRRDGEIAEVKGDPDGSESPPTAAILRAASPNSRALDIVA